ncbi:MAG: glutamate--tRNA ligase [Candidatus Aenigmatarchaeota archaeon]
MEPNGELVRRYCLDNAVEHGGKANARSVLSKLLGDHPELRSNVLQLKSAVEDTTEKVNVLSHDTQKKQLSELGTIERREKVERKGLPELPRAKKGEFIVRFAPNPDGTLHVGGARPAILNYEYAEKYNGKFFLRFDDTDPSGTLKSPKKEFYKMMIDDLKWLGVKPDAIFYASKRLAIYYKHAEEAIRVGAAYVCTCPSENWKKKRSKSQACDCRGASSADNMKKWKDMLKNKYKKGHAVLRVKTDLEHRNPAVRDWVAFRIIDKPVHPLVKGKHVWPTYNFQSAIDDHLLGVTHILRGQEHSTNEVKQQFLYEWLKWEYPVTVLLGRFSMTDCVLSKSTIAEGIARGEYSGWDDLRLGTIRTLKRKGIQSAALREMIMDIGSKPSDITISLENLAAYNRRAIDSIAKRFFFVKDPVEIVVENPLKRSAELKMHPDKKLGKRQFKLGKKFFIESEDFDRYKGMEVRLKDLYNIKLERESKATSVENNNTPKIHWVPQDAYIQVRVLESKNIIEGIGETNLKKLKPGDIIQFERFGFCRVEKVQPKAVVVVMSHT